MSRLQALADSSRRTDQAARDEQRPGSGGSRPTAGPSLYDPALVYVLEADHGVKVGITIQTIEQRVTDLERASGLHITVIRTYPIAEPHWARTIERAAHWMLRDTRKVGEWFHCHPFEATDVIEYLLHNGLRIYYMGIGQAAA